MNSLTVAMTLLLGQAAVGPEDAFRANFSAIHARAKYRFQATGAAPLEALAQLRSWNSADVSFVEQPRSALNIEWACDGVGQDVISSPTASTPTAVASTPTANSTAPADGLARGGPIAPAQNTYAEKGFEVLWDGEIQIEHRLDRPDVQVHPGDTLGMLSGTSGPFLLWGTLKYPSHLRVNFPKSAPAIHSATLGGRHLVVAAYVDEFAPNGWARLDIWHDPSIGYLPRFARYVVRNPSGATCREYFLLDAQPCSGGGFVPTKAYEARFDIDPPDRSRRFEFNSQSPAPAPRSQIHMRRLEATEFKDTKSTTALENLVNAKTIAAKGGSVPLNTGAPLTIDRIRLLLGRKLTDPAPPRLPPIDYAELNEFSEPARRRWLPYCIGATLAVGVGVLCYWRWNRRLAALAVVALGVIAGQGCSPGGKEVLGLTATFDRTPIIYSQDQTTIPLMLSVRNVGTVPLRLLNLDGGCSCRQVDTSDFPALVHPTQVHTLRVDMAPRSLSGSDRFVFRAQTDRGSVDLPVTLLAFARNAVSPDAIGSPILLENEDWEFTLIHRAVFELSVGAPGLALKETEGFLLDRQEIKRGQIAAAPQFTYEDTTYRVVLKDRQLGIHKALLTLTHSDGRPEREIPVVWRRAGYLSTFPERAYLGSRPLRVFLRCPDEGVELTRVLSVPPGVKAVVSSPREITVMLGDAAPPVIDGLIPIETTATARPPLRLPVVRYSVASRN